VPRLAGIIGSLILEFLTVAVEDEPHTIVAECHVLKLPGRAVIVVDGAVDSASVDLGVPA
jgi:hypothetical protein